MTVLNAWPRVTGITAATTAFVVDAAADTSPATKSILGDDLIASLTDGQDIAVASLEVSDIVNVGTSTDTNSSDPMVNVNRTVDGTGTNGHCFSDSSTVDRAGGVAYNSYDCRVVVEGTDSYNHFASMQNAIDVGTSGTTGKLYGFLDAPAVSAGTVTNRFGFQCNDFTGAGTVTNQYGFYCPELTGASGDNYAVHVRGDTASYFGGPVEFENPDVAPSASISNGAVVYAKDQAAGNSCIHARTENGAIIKLYQQSTVSDPSGGATVDAEARTAINALIDLLQANGLMA